MISALASRISNSPLISYLSNTKYILSIFDHANPIPSTPFSHSFLSANSFPCPPSYATQLPSLFLHFPSSSSRPPATPKHHILITIIIASLAFPKICCKRRQSQPALPALNWSHILFLHLSECNGW